MIRKKKLYKRPQKPFEAGRIKAENELVKKYGLKSKREIWKTQAKVDYYRGRAKDLAKKSLEEQEVLFRKLKAIGLKTDSIAEVLDLKVEDLLKRRLTTVMADKKIADTPKQARQMVVHKRVTIKDKVVSAPSYLVLVADESAIKLKTKNKVKKKSEEKKNEAIAEEVPAEESVSEENAEASE